MRNAPDNSCKENQSTNFMFNNFSENPAIYEIWRKKLWYSRTGHRW